VFVVGVTCQAATTGTFFAFYFLFLHVFCTFSLCTSCTILIIHIAWVIGDQGRTAILPPPKVMRCLMSTYHINFCCPLLIDALPNPHYATACHPTQVNTVTTHLALTSARQAGTRFIYPGGWKAELTQVTGYMLRWFTCLQTVIHPSTNPAV